MSRIVLAMSGGVDSSAAAYLLREEGHEVIGVFMRHGEEAQEACRIDSPGLTLPIFNPRADHKQGCCSASDAEDARRVADKLDIPFYALNLQAEFKQIIDYFVDEYTRGRTPNPCVQCNNWLKFGKLFDYADSVGAEFVATGHYARLIPAQELNAPPALLRGIDDGKDQSYVLFGIKKHLLPRMLLPVGGFLKPQIRELAAKVGLRVADKKDSQEICFVTSGKHDEFVRQRQKGKSTAGEIVTTDGRVVGTHPGIERFTIGQRKGMKVAMGEPYFVVRIEPASRRVVIGRQEDLARSELTAEQCNWLVDPPGGPFRCLAKIRYNSSPAPATAEILPANRLRVLFDEPRHGVAPGQAVVCYDGERVLGGGWIE
ncbi:MAG: tRNA 2-thiouridine(34) synthase MnmA [Pirellulaceae bacterium]